MKISVIGVGAMGGAIVEGLVKSNKISPKDITVSAPHKTTTDKFATLGVNATNDNVKAVEGAELIVVAVKPWLAETVLGEIKNHIDYKRQAIISVMAGVSGEKLLNMLADNSGNKPNVYVVIPNIAIAQLCSMNFIVPIKGDENTTEKIKALFDATGLSILTEEKLQRAKEDMPVLHPLPRVNEIAKDVDNDKRAAYFEQVQNGVYVRMALIMALLGLTDPLTNETVL